MLISIRVGGVGDVGVGIRQDFSGIVSFRGFPCLGWVSAILVLLFAFNFFLLRWVCLV